MFESSKIPSLSSSAVPYFTFISSFLHQSYANGGGGGDGDAGYGLHTHKSGALR